MLTVSLDVNGETIYEYSEGTAFDPCIPKDCFYAPSDPTGKRKDPALIMGCVATKNGSHRFSPQIVVYEDTPIGAIPYNFNLDSIHDIFTDIDLSSYGYKRVAISRWIKR